MIVESKKFGNRVYYNLQGIVDNKQQVSLEEGKVAVGEAFKSQFDTLLSYAAGILNGSTGLDSRVGFNQNIVANARRLYGDVTEIRNKLASDATKLSNYWITSFYRDEEKGEVQYVQLFDESTLEGNVISGFAFSTIKTFANPSRPTVIDNRVARIEVTTTTDGQQGEKLLPTLTVREDVSAFETKSGDIFYATGKSGKVNKVLIKKGTLAEDMSNFKDLLTSSSKLQFSFRRATNS